MKNDSKITALRMERQFLSRRANKDEYLTLYRDLQPGQNVYWNGFGDPPSLTFRADFDDIAFNRVRQARHELIKGRFSGGNLGWIVPEDLELFMALYRKPLLKPTAIQRRLLTLIEREGPLTIQMMKEETGLLVKEITPALHRLQEAFLIYEDQYDGEWDRGWYRFGEMFPDIDPDKYTRSEALKIILQRFAYRLVLFDTVMAKSFYKLPEKEIKAAVSALVTGDVLIETDNGYLLKTDCAKLSAHAENTSNTIASVYALHRNDILVKSNEHVLKEQFKPLYEHLEYDREPLQYLLIDGEIHGISVGHFRNGPYDLNDVVTDLPDTEARKEEILEAVRAVNGGKTPKRFMGKEI
ncbi:MAG TPA: hypothetical protein PK854_12365 [Oscillospiraceae bacterium]|nr:hypothetical protein [Oscillospiraceae bacterium]HPS36044.1 hypothetical protein [Oscillospiraceae bacterium]